jgi:hypothetical protein
VARNDATLTVLRASAGDYCLRASVYGVAASVDSRTLTVLWQSCA